MIALQNSEYYSKMHAAAAKYAGALSALKTKSEDGAMKLHFEQLEKEFNEVVKYIELVTDSRVRGIAPKDSDIYSVDESDRRI